MKTTIISLLAFALVLSACNNNKPKGITVSSEDGKSTVTVDANSVAAARMTCRKKWKS